MLTSFTVVGDVPHATPGMPEWGQTTLMCACSVHGLRMSELRHQKQELLSKRPEAWKGPSEDGRMSMRTCAEWTNRQSLGAWEMAPERGDLGEIRKGGLCVSKSNGPGLQQSCKASKFGVYFATIEMFEGF